MSAEIDCRAVPEDAEGIGRFGARSVLGATALVLGAVPYLLLWLLVQQSWAPLAGVDGAVAAALNRQVRDSPLVVSSLRVVTDLGGSGTAVLLLTLAMVFLLIRGRRRLAVFVATTGLGLAVLVPVTKAIAHRARPVVASPVVETPSNGSFPSGHAMTALVTWGVLLLLVLPSVRRRARPWLVAAAGVLVVGVGFTRLALGVHFLSDVLAGWALGLAWLAIMTATFRAWQHDSRPPTAEPLDPLDVSPAEAARATSAPGPGRTRSRASALCLLGVALALVLVFAGLGLVVTRWLSDGWLGDVDRSLIAFFVDARTPERTTVMKAIGELAGTRAVLAIGSILAVIGLARTATWQPVVFVVSALAGEVLIYFITAQVVGRMRPAVPDLTSGLPVGASWPSGHSAAAAALYGAAAALVLAYGRGPHRAAVVLLPAVLAPAIAISRVYVAAHHPTDVLAGLTIGGLWVTACALLLLPPPRRGVLAGVQSAPGARPGSQPASPHRASSATEPTRRAAVIVQPLAVDAAALRCSLDERMRELGWLPPQWFETTVHDPGTGPTRRALGEGVDLVLCCGDDGTARAVATALAGSGVPLGLLPASTGNLLARNLGVPIDLADALDVALSGRDQVLDVGIADGERFVMMAGVGVDAAMVADASPALKEQLGWPAYIASAVRHLTDEPITVSLRVDDGRELTRRARGVVVGNVAELQGGIRLLPAARATDGLLDVAVLGSLGLVGWARAASRVLIGRARSDPLLERFQARQVDLHAHRPVPHDLDGDPRGTVTSVTFSVDPGVLVVRVPR